MAVTDKTTDEAAPAIKPPPIATGTGPRWGSAGIPVERAGDFGTVTKRLVSRLRHDRFRVAVVIVLAFASVTMLVLGPKILGNATDVVVR
ncbi:MAG: ATP-binding cassette, subfamily multidrug efflux pump, partial [Actinomycetota bacterium]|nr:ATP-binding cassette, subfamily multidrug efflux pump [Actinomycetota bacterium]